MVSHRRESSHERSAYPCAMDATLFKKTFRERKLRLSHARFSVFEELSRTERPLSPRELYDDLLRKKKRIGLTSIYRALDLLESLGIVFKTMSGAVARYRLCGMERHHHHIVCERCGEVVEFDFCDLPHWRKHLDRMTGYKITAHRFEFVGLCRRCREKA